VRDHHADANGRRHGTRRCAPLNGDINGDGTYGQLSFGDINPFVTLLTGGG
jgi:hypothetical protein